MRTYRTALVAIGLLGGIILLGILFPNVLLDNLVTPLAFVLWMFWRVLQSVGQPVYWGALIVVALVFTLARLVYVTDVPPPFSPARQHNPNATLDRIDYWRMLIRLTSDDTERFGILKQNLGRVLAALHASSQSEAVYTELYGALKSRQIPVPAHIYAFLFPAEPSGARRSFKRVVRAIRQALEKWSRRWTGRDEVEYYERLEAVIAFLEATLEAKHGDSGFRADRY